MKAATPLLLLVISVSFAAAQMATGGQFALDQSVVATGGSTKSTGGQFELGGTTGQTVAGHQASNQSFTIHAGFWMPDAFMPTAAGVTIRGRVTTIDGRALPRVTAVLYSPDGTQQYSVTNGFGFFSFTNVEVGKIYVLGARGKGLSFTTRVFSLMDELADADLTAFPN